ncbi:MAG: cob(I)yrinic acid a,c-diamide adenosyltransferase [bacterium]
MSNGLLIIYTGEGKGKTTASLGLAMRACGHGLNVCVLQFLKKGETGEIKFSRRHSRPLIIPLGLGNLIIPGQEDTNETINCAISYTLIRVLMELDIFDMIILDEIGIISNLGLIDTASIINLTKERPDNLTIVMTGRDVPKQLIEIADIVSEIREIKHYFNRVARPQKGIEF